MELSDIIVQRIKANGPITFREFMEMCLYYPELGYYTSKKAKIGPEGDFYTSSCLTPIFGALIGKQLEEMWVHLGKEPFTIVEYGAGTGMLCHDILSYLRNNEMMYAHLKYYIIEKSSVMKEIEKEHLGEKVSWCDSPAELPEITGCVLSNELVDTFAVHQVVMDNRLMEVFVDYDQSFKEVLFPACDELKEYHEELRIELPRGYRAEVNLQAIKWIREIAAVLKRGYLLTIDYGCLSDDLYKPCRNNGTLLGFKNHRINHSLYENVGTQDITSHVNFSALLHWGAKNGLEECGFTSQCNFLLAMGFKEHVLQTYSHEEDIIRTARKIAVLSNILLIEMGNKFKFLIQNKGVTNKKLTGLAIA